MTIEEIEELLELKGWERRELAYHLDLSEAAIWKWLRERKDKIRGPAGILMRQWLTEARLDAAKGKRAVPA